MTTRRKALWCAIMGVLILLNVPDDCAIAPFLWGYTTAIASLMFIGGLFYIVGRDL